MQNEEIIRWIWERQEGQVGFIAVRRKGRWKDIPLPTDFDSVDLGYEDQDVYFTPLTFVAPHRSNDTAAGARVLFADLDPVDPETLSVRPSMAWRTSPGNYQALWFMFDELSHAQFANLNRRLTMLTGADPGGWMGSKVLRVPDTTNFKYDPPVDGQLLWFEPDTMYTADYFEDQLPDIPSPPGVGPGGAPDPITQDQSMQFISDRWKGMTLRGRAMLMKKRVPDRSLHVVQTIHELLKTGMATNSVFNLIWWRPWNKWRTDRHRPEQLWAEINRAKMKLVD